MSSHPLLDNEQPLNSLQEISPTTSNTGIQKETNGSDEKIEAPYDLNDEEKSIEVKDERNLLPDVFQRLPHEILGCIFDLIIPPLRNCSSYGRPKKGTYNFLIVCKRWNAVALGNLRLRSYWGMDLEACCDRTGNIPIDLVLVCLKPKASKELNDTALKALKDRAAQDQILQIHLDMNGDRHHNPLNPILSSLTPGDREGQPPQEKHIENFAVNSNYIPGELQNFFAQTSLPNLKRLQIHQRREFGAQLWNSLTLHGTTGLTSLSVSLNSTQHVTDPVRYPLLEILRANPGLRHLVLSGAPPNPDHNCNAKVPLPQLRTIYLGGPFESAFALLQALDLPAELHTMEFAMVDPTLTDIRTRLGPYMRELIENNANFKGRKLEVITDSGKVSIAVHYLECSGHEASAEFLISRTSFDDPPDSPWPTTYLIGFIPGVRTLEMTADNSRIPLLATMPILNQFESLESLESLSLDHVTPGDGHDWQPLIDFLQTHQLDHLCVNTSSPDMPTGVKEQVRKHIKDMDFELEGDYSPLWLSDDDSPDHDYSDSDYSDYEYSDGNYIDGDDSDTL